MTIRINKFLAQCGIGSRRKIDNLISANRILINGIPARLGIQVDPTRDDITVDGKSVNVQEEHVYYLLNKPKGVISTAIDTHGRPTVKSLIPTDKRIFPVGRLDKDTTGLLILTNDGALTNVLTHPRYHIAKSYVATVVGSVSQKTLRILRTGVWLQDGITQPAEVDIISATPTRTVLKIILHEGRNRQIRRMMSAVHLELVALQRIAIGALTIGDLSIGKFRSMTSAEVQYLQGVMGTR